MGMDASQGRLLALTAQLHNVELKAQAKMAEKVALATRKDAVYQEYCDALDATSIMVAFSSSETSSTYVDANFKSLCTYNPDRKKDYTLINNHNGNVIVTKEIKDAYDNYGRDKYLFAYAMIGLGGCEGYGDKSGEGMFIGIGTMPDVTDHTSDGGEGYSLYMTEAEQIVYDANSSDSQLKEKYEEIDRSPDDATKRIALETFRDYLYSEYAPEIFEQMNIDKEDGVGEVIDSTWGEIEDEFDYYIRLWEAINEAGGCETIDPVFENGEKGNNWFNTMVEAGRISIQVWNETGRSDTWSQTTAATSLNRNHLQEMPNDENAKRAEIAYEHELDIISQKDAEYDRELSKLETIRSSITTEIESIEKVRDENIDRTFGIFS